MGVIVENTIIRKLVYFAEYVSFISNKMLKATKLKTKINTKLIRNEKLSVIQHNKLLQYTTKLITKNFPIALSNGNQVQGIRNVPSGRRHLRLAYQL